MGDLHAWAREVCMRVATRVIATSRVNGRQYRACLNSCDQGHTRYGAEKPALIQEPAVRHVMPQCISVDHGAHAVILELAASVIIQSPQARKPLDRMCVHAGDGQTYLSGLDSMS